jgi:hypothetical protein
MAWLTAEELALHLWWALLKVDMLVFYWVFHLAERLAKS